MRRPTRDITLALITLAVFVAVVWLIITHPPGGV